MISSRCRAVVLLAAGLLTGCGAAAPAPDAVTVALSEGDTPALAPAHTFALLVGLLEWQDPSIGTFPQAARQDRALERLLLERGVPREQLVFLQDAEATKARVLDELSALAARAPTGSTLIYYFAGHGSLEDDDE